MVQSPKVVEITERNIRYPFNMTATAPNMADGQGDLDLMLPDRLNAD